MVLAYDAAGNVIATLDHLVQYADDVDRTPLGLIDFAAHELAGGEHIDIWRVSNAAGSKIWPEWLGSRAHDFRVELEGPPSAKRIARLVHRQSGHIRERSVIEQAIAARIRDSDSPADLRDLVGGPARPLPLDDEGRNAPRGRAARPDLPLVGVRR